MTTPITASATYQNPPWRTSAAKIRYLPTKPAKGGIPVRLKRKMVSESAAMGALVPRPRRSLICSPPVTRETAITTRNAPTFIST